MPPFLHLSIPPHQLLLPPTHVQTLGTRVEIVQAAGFVHLTRRLPRVAHVDMVGHVPIARTTVSAYPTLHLQATD